MEKREGENKESVEGQADESTNAAGGSGVVSDSPDSISPTSESDAPVNDASGDAGQDEGDEAGE